MKLSISNIAWDVGEDSAVVELLHRHGIDAIDIAPGKYFPDPASTDEAHIAAVRQWWLDRGIAIIGMQALLFGTQGLNVFGPAPVQAAMLDHLGHVCRIGAGLGANLLTFGSPRNRDRSGLADAQALDIAVAFFRRLGDVATGTGVQVCLEPNPPEYGANFMVTAEETAAVVRRVDHPAIRMQFDTGAFAMTGEDTDGFLAKNASLVGHVHASEPNLVPLGDGATDHDGMARALGHWLPANIVTIEMVSTQGEPHPASIDRAIAVALSTYGQAQGRTA